MKKTTLQDMRDILVTSPEGSDRHFWGVVTSQNKNAQGKVTSYEVALGGDEGTMTCRKLAGAEVGDTVMVTLTKTGMAVRANERMILDARDRGEREVSVPMVSVYTRYSPLWGLKYLDMEDPASWPNHDMARALGVDAILGFEEGE